MHQFILVRQGHVELHGGRKGTCGARWNRPLIKSRKGNNITGKESPLSLPKKTEFRKDYTQTQNGDQKKEWRKITPEWRKITPKLDPPPRVMKARKRRERQKETRRHCAAHPINNLVGNHSINEISFDEWSYSRRRKFSIQKKRFNSTQNVNVKTRRNPPQSFQWKLTREQYVFWSSLIFNCIKTIGAGDPVWV